MRDRQRDQRLVDAVRRQDADRVGAEPDEGGVAERHQRAVADEEIEREAAMAKIITRVNRPRM